jgi:stress-induced morphogen
MDDFKFVKELITQNIPDAQVEVEDLTGTRDHLGITVVSDIFKDKMLFQQHQMIMLILKEELKTRIHAVKLQTYTPDKFEKAKKENL